MTLEGQYERRQGRRPQRRRAPPPSSGPAIPPKPARRPTVDPSPTADAEVGRRRASGFPMPAIPAFPPAPQSSPSPQAGLDPRNRPYQALQHLARQAYRGRGAQPTGIQGSPPQAGPPQIAGQGPTPPYASQAPMGSAMPSFGQNWVARSQNPYAYGLAQSGILNQTQTPQTQRFTGNVNRPNFTYGLNPNNPMWANAPQQGPGSPWDYYAGVPQQGLDMGNPPGPNVPRAPGSTGWGGVYRQWNPNEINPQGMMQMMQDFGGQWPPGAIMNPLFNPLMGR